MQNRKWTKYLLYGLGELFLVVLGILVAFQLEDKRNDFADRKKEASLKALINKEFKENKSHFEYITSMHKGLFQSTQWILDHQPISKEQPDSVKKYLANCFRYYTFNPSYSSITTIINTGQIDIIQDEKLRLLLASWEDAFKDYSEEEQVSTQAFNTHFVSYFRDKIPFETIVGPKPITLNEDFETITFYNLINERHILTNFVLMETDHLVQHIDSIIALTAN